MHSFTPGQAGVAGVAARMRRRASARSRRLDEMPKTRLKSASTPKSHLETTLALHTPSRPAQHRKNRTKFERASRARRGAGTGVAGRAKKGERARTRAMGDGDDSRSERATSFRSLGDGGVRMIDNEVPWGIDDVKPANHIIWPHAGFWGGRFKSWPKGGKRGSVWGMEAGGVWRGRQVIAGGPWVLTHEL